MKTLLILAAVFAVLFLAKRALAGDILTPMEAARRVTAGTALLIDVREPAEFAAERIHGALNFPLSTFDADALPAARILAFYQRYLTTVSDGVENGVAWYGGDLTTFSWAAEKTKVRRPTPLPPGGVNIASPI